ncbi:MAG: sterol desaturase family protein [Pseudomonadota bacterium]
MTFTEMIVKDQKLPITLAVVPLVAVLLVAAVLLGGNPLHLALAFVFGWFYWTLLEYLLHRFLMHWEPRGPLGRFARSLIPGHKHHHEAPTQYEEDGAVLIKFMIRPALFALLWWPLVTGSLTIGLAITAGNLAGYLAYEIVHAACHFLKLNFPYGRALKRHHAVHHYRDDTVNFGVTTTLWDWVFATKWRPQRKRAAA